MSYDQLAAAVDRLGASNGELTEQSLLTQQTADAARVIAEDKATIATSASNSANASKVSAADSAAAALASKNSAAASASTATQKAGEAVTSATAALASQGAAKTSETNAKASEVAAAPAIAAGLRFCGSLATAPTTRTNGTALQRADEYQNTVDNLRYSWSGTVWIALNSSAQQLEVRLADATTGGTNIGFTQSGNGAPSKTVKDKLLTGTISVFDFMTPAQIADVKSPSPALDVSGAVLAAILASRGKRLVFEPATAYTFDNLVVVYASQVSNCEIDLAGQKILWRGDRKTDGTQGAQYDWNWGVLSFKGEVLNTASTTAFTTLAEGTNTLSLPGHSFAVGDHAFIKITDAAAGGSTLLKFKLLSRHCKVVGVAGNDVTFDYRTSFVIPSGSSVSVSKLRPMIGVTVKNPNIEDVSAYPYGGATTDDQKWKGASGIVFEYAAFCHSYGGRFKGIPKVSLEGQACYGCSFGNSELDTPKETVSGGYLAKFEDSLYCFARGLQADNERHVIDFTASSNCVVERSGSWKTANATFVTHGTYEHDITWRDCWGYMSMAGSGADFGQKNRRMKVERHTGSNLNIASSGQSVYDSIFEDCDFTSVSYLNVDGNLFERCTFSNLTSLQQNGTFSGKKTVFNETYLNQTQSPFIPAGVTSNLEFYGGGVFCLGAADILGTGKVLLSQVAFSTAGSPTFSGARLTVEGGSFELRGAATIIACSLPYLAFTGAATVRAGFSYTGASGSHEIVLDSSTFDLVGKTTSATFAIAKTGGTVDLRSCNNLFDRTGGTDRHLTAITAGAVLRITDTGNTYKGGTVRVDAVAVASGSLIHADNTLVGTTLALPEGYNNRGIERGSNAKGEFTKFPDGTLITWGKQLVSVAVPAGQGVTWSPGTANQPSPFVGTPNAEVRFAMMSGTGGTGNALYTMQQFHYQAEDLATVGVNMGTQPSLSHPLMTYGTTAAASYFVFFKCTGRWK